MIDREKSIYLMISIDRNDHLQYVQALNFYWKSKEENNDDDDDDDTLYIPVEFVMMSSAKMTEHNDLETNKTCVYWRSILHGQFLRKRQQFEDSINYAGPPIFEEKER